VFVGLIHDGVHLCRQGVNDPNVLSMITDSADCTRYIIPFFRELTQATAEWRIRTHVVGALVHGHGSYVYLHTDKAAKGANITIEAIHRTLNKG
jgi:hypothetical protein